MSRSLNRATLIGNLGKDAETSYTASQISVTKFSIATERRWRDKGSGEWKTETDWHNIVAWRIENLAPYLLKGGKVYVEGRLQTSTWDDKDGKKHYKTEIVADEIILLGSKDGQQSGPRQAGAPPPRQAPPQGGWGGDGGYDTDPDVPF